MCIDVFVEGTGLGPRIKFFLNKHKGRDMILPYLYNKDKQYFVHRAVGRGSVVRVRRSTKQQENEWQLQWQQEARRRGLFSTTGIYDAGQWQQPLVRGQKAGAGGKKQDGAAEGGAATQRESEDGAKREGEK